MSSVILTDARVTEGYQQYALQKKMVEDKIWRCCDNCNGKTEKYRCVFNGNQPIPPEIISIGCGKWDDLPF